MIYLGDAKLTPERLQAILANLEERQAKVTAFPATGWAAATKEIILLDINTDIALVKLAMKDEGAEGRH